MLGRYLIGGVPISDSDESFQMALNHAHGKRDRPLCLCRDAPIPMYIARIDGRFFVKRMPNSGATHDPMCASYEPPPELSGLGNVLGNAITDDCEEGGTTLRVGFSLTRRPGRGAIAQAGSISDSVESDANKLTLRSTLHYLWDQAGFNRWSPRMEGKRSWHVIRRHLLGAAEGKTMKGQGLGDLLYVPEAWAKEHADEIKARRDQTLSRIVPTTGGARSLMLCIGECKTVQQSVFGYKLIIKHAPDFSIFFSKEVHERIEKRFAMEFGLKETIADSHMMFIATFGLNVSRGADLDEISFVMCTKDWIPFETPDEASLVESLVSQRRHFVKGLRYNVAAGEPLATAVLLDSVAKETALYIVPASASEQYHHGIEELQANSSLPHWTWNVGEHAQVPALPSLAMSSHRGASSGSPKRHEAVRSSAESVARGASS